MTFEEWEAHFPEAAHALNLLYADIATSEKTGKSEAWAQQKVRFKFAQMGGLLWRNNVGATPAECPQCREALRPVRYGLCNDSAKLNKQFKSSDLIGLIPVRIEARHVGQVIGQFAAIETKRPGWEFSGDEHEKAQANFLTMVRSKGGIGIFSTGDV